MGLFDLVDSIVGTDFSGNKARKEIDKALGLANQANQAAMQIIQQAGDKAISTYREYMKKGMTEYDAAHQAAIEALRDAGTTSEKTFTDWFNKARLARKPFTDATTQALGAVPVLSSALGLPSDVAYDVTASPLYNWQLNQLDEQLTAHLNALGLRDSGVGAAIRSKNVGQLGAEERQRQINDLMNLSSMGLQAGQSLGSNEMGAGQVLAGNQLNVGSSIADLYNQAAINRANMFNNLGNNIADVQMGVGGNMAQGTIAQGQNIMNAGISKAQIPNPMNTLINTGLQLYGMGAFTPARNPALLSNMSNLYTRNIGMPFIYGLSNIPGLGG